MSLDIGSAYEKSLPIALRKKDGIFYTPKYITKYIIENTVGKLCEEKKAELKLLPEDVINFDIINYQTKYGQPSAKGKRFSNTLHIYKKYLLSLKILDPACGSGAFLNEVFNFLIAEHKQIDKIILQLKNDPLQILNTDKDILENNIFGVDINEESIEITKRSLWLITARIGRPFSFLSNNIKCGNSLINDPKIAGKKAFDWNKEFKGIMNNGGFDVIIGNPPYVNIVNIKNKSERNYLKKEYKTVKNKSDLYSIFTEKSFHLLKENQIFSFIFSNSWLGTGSFSKFRNFLIENTEIIELIKLPAKVFKDSTVTTIIIIFRKKIATKHKIILKEYVNEQFTKIKHTLDYERINLTTFKTFSFEPEIKINIKTVKLGKIAKFSLGIKTSDDKRFILNKKIDNDCYPVLRGRHISKYYYKKPNEWIWYKPDLMRERKGAGVRHLEHFLRDKILIQDVANKITACFDNEKKLSNGTLNLIYDIEKSYNLKFILVLLNSFLLNKIFKTTFPAGLHIKINQLKEIPIPLISKEAQKPFIEKADLMLSLNKKFQIEKNNFLNTLQEKKPIEKLSRKLQNFEKLEYDDFKKEVRKKKAKINLGSENNEWREYFNSTKQKINRLQNLINQTDKEIDKMVYELYELTEEEIKIIENT